MADELIKIIEKLSLKYGKDKVFSDFLEMTAIAFSNTTDHSPVQKKREKRYLSLIGRYEKSDANMFPEMVAILVKELEKKPKDVLGFVFEELKLNNTSSGQFFTPPSISRLMSEITLDDAVIKEKVASEGFITCSDPACGSGTLLIEFINHLKRLYINYQRCLHMTCYDIDIRSVYMCYIQMTLLGVPAKVIHGDALANKVYDTWYTPFHIILGWDWKLKRNFENVKLKTC